MNISAPAPELSHFMSQLLQACQSSGLPIKLKITIGGNKRHMGKNGPEKQESSQDLPAEVVPVIDALPEQLLSTDQAASILDVSKDTLNKYREQGRLVGLNMNKHDKQLRPIWKYRRSDLEDFIRSLRENTESGEQH